MVEDEDEEEVRGRRTAPPVLLTIGFRSDILMQRRNDATTVETKGGKEGEKEGKKQPQRRRKLRNKRVLDPTLLCEEWPATHELATWVD